MSKKIDELQQSLKKKDEDMRQMEDRYKHYVEKARTVSTPPPWLYYAVLIVLYTRWLPSPSSFFICGTLLQTSPLFMFNV